MNKINAEIVADSISPQGSRITSFILTYPRFIHSELMTHRMFSRNSASSRAIPFAKMVKMVEKDPFIPIAWQKDHKGMQGTEYFTDESQINSKISCWLNARNHALRSAKYLNSDLVVHKIGDEEFISFNQFDEDHIADLMAEKRLENTKVTKQLCNRLLEPFMWHTVLVTATEYDNFFELRCPKYKFGDKYYKSKSDLYKEIGSDLDAWEHENDLWWYSINESGAEIHIQALAEAMWDAMNESIPKQLKAGEWHIPFEKQIDISKLDNYYRIHIKKVRETFAKLIYDRNLYKLKIATARCARLSYVTFDGEIDYEKDIKLHDHLLESYHMSPCEHVARCMTELEYYSFVKGQVPSTKDDWGILNYEYYPYFTSDISSEWFDQPKGEHKNNGNRYGWCNNFRGWIPYRYLIENEQ